MVTDKGKELRKQRQTGTKPHQMKPERARQQNLKIRVVEHKTHGKPNLEAQ